MSNQERGIISRLLRRNPDIEKKEKNQKIQIVEINKSFRPFAKIGKVTAEDITKQIMLSSAGVFAQGEISLSRITDPFSIEEGIILGYPHTKHFAGHDHIWVESQEPFSLEIELDFHETVRMPYCLVSSKTDNITAVEDWPELLSDHYFYNSFHLENDNQARSIIIADDPKLIKNLEITFGLINPESIPDAFKRTKFKDL